MEANRKWLLVSLILAFVSLGPLGLTKLIFCVLLLAGGAILVIYSITLVTARDESNTTVEKHPWWRYPLGHPIHGEAISAASTRLTGIQLLDDELHDILNFVFRDHILPWQTQLSHSNLFSNQVQGTLRVAISALSDRIRAVDWIPFLTTRMVNDIVSHVRLYKKARILHKTRTKDSDNGKSDLESAFFDAEVALEEGQMCRDLVSTIHQEENIYFQDVVELLLFLLLPKNDFGGQSLRMFTRELLVNVLVKPSLDLISDPDFLNQTIVWVYKEYQPKPDLFMQTVRFSERVEELQATRELVTKEIGILRSNDSKSENDSSLKQQLNSLLHLRKLIDSRIHRLQNGSETDSMGLPAQIDWNQMIGPGLKLFALPLEVILKSNIALSFFIDYMSSIGCQAYIFFYLNIEGWKVSTEQQLSVLLEESSNTEEDQGSLINRDSLIDNMREAAHSIYEQYLSEKANPRLKLDDSAVKRLLFKIRTEPPDPDWFEEVQEGLFEKLQTDERFFESFKKSMGYVKLLAELDLLKDPSTRTDEEDSASLGDDFSIYDSLSIGSLDDCRGPPSRESSLGADLNEVGDIKASELGDPELDSTLTKTDDGEMNTSKKSHKRNGSDIIQSRLTLPTATGHHRNASQSSLDFVFSNAPILQADITDVEMRSEKIGKPYAVYKIVVKSRDVRGQVEDVRTIYRRYSDFYTLHEKISNKFPELAKLEFPSKKTFGNTQSQVLEKRQKMLRTYLQNLLKKEVLEVNPGLLELLQRFLDQFAYEKERSQASNVAKAVGSVRNSVMSVGHVVTAVPGQLIHTVDNVVDNLSKVLQPTSKTMDHNNALMIDPKFDLSNVDSGASDNIPLRITLMFMDEVFDLRERNQWLRRHIVAVLRQILKAMFGDIVNRRIVEYFAAFTSPMTLSGYLRSLKDSLWPNGYPAEQQPLRDEATKMRTRVAAKTALFSSLSEELKRVIGSETSRSGLLMLFDMLQHPVLNKRLAIVLLESILDVIFQEQDFPSIFQKLHSHSTRVKNELRISQRKHADLRR